MPYQLSGGQQQRTVLVRALAPQPEVILLDEPFSNLDASLRRKLRIEIKRILNEAGVSVVFVSHDQQEAFSLADRVAVMMDEKLLQTASPDKLYHQPVTMQVSSFIGEANFLPAEINDSLIQCDWELLLWPPGLNPDQQSR